MNKSLDIFISEEDRATIFNMSACNFAPGDIALQLGINKKYFLEVFNDKESQVRQMYDAGKLNAIQELMTKQLELGKTGNITAAQIYLKESERIEFNNLRNKCFFGDDA